MYRNNYWILVRTTITCVYTSRCHHSSFIVGCHPCLSLNVRCCVLESCVAHSNTCHLSPVICHFKMSVIKSHSVTCQNTPVTCQNVLSLVTLSPATCHQHHWLVFECHMSAIPNFPPSPLPCCSPSPSLPHSLIIRIRIDGRRYASV